MAAFAGGILLVLSCFVVPSRSQMTEMHFTCKRPTTACDPQQGICDDVTGKCTCLNNALGLQCELPAGAVDMFGAPVNTSANDACAIQNPCVRGTCYDNGVQATCLCPDGVYGWKCQHDMLYMECDKQTMVINSYPYGFGDAPIWNAPYPVTGAYFNCSLEPIATFLISAIGYNNRGWEGFGGTFLHQNDPCAGDATLEFENATMATYSRYVLVSYSVVGSHATDQKLYVRCDVQKSQTATATTSVPLSPPVVTVNMADEMNQPITGPVKLGSNVKAMFSVNLPNSAGMTDIQVSFCSFTDGQLGNSLAVVENSCAVLPVGVSLYKLAAAGTSELTLRMYRFNLTSNNLNFQCKVRLCGQLDRTCSIPPVCNPVGRRKREAALEDEEDYETVQFVARLA